MSFVILTFANSHGITLIKLQFGIPEIKNGMSKSALSSISWFEICGIEESSLEIKIEGR